MSISRSKKSLVLLGAMLLSAETALSKVPYSFFSAIGNVADAFLAKGELSEKHKDMFEDVALKLDIQDRGIKPKNSGLFLRLAFGYHNAIAINLFNRVYFNENTLLELSNEEKKFLMAHELTHHKQHHSWQRLAAGLAINRAQKKAINIAANKGFIETEVITGPSGVPVLKITEKNPLKRYITSGFPLKSFLDFTVCGLIQAQLAQHHETEADTQAITVADVDPDAGVKLIDYLHHPKTANWPLYAKIQNGLAQLMMPVMSLPVIRWHVPHLASHKLRIAHLKSLKNEWESNKSAEKDSKSVFQASTEQDKIAY